MDATNSTPTGEGAADHDRDVVAPQALEAIRASLRGLRFGSVNIIVQDGVVIQIDRTEKRRLNVSSRSRRP